MLKNTALMTASRVASIAASLLAVPLIIKQLGIAGYGTWESITALSGLTATIHSVIVGTLLWKMSEAFGRRDHRELNRYAGIGLFAALLLAFAATLLIWVFTRPILDFIKVPAERLESASWILPLAMTVAAFSGINEVLAAIIGAHQRIGVASMIQGGSLVLTQITVLVGLQLQWGLWSLLVGSALGFLTSYVALTAVGVKICSHVKFRAVIPSRSELRSVSQYAAYLLAGTAAVSLREHTDKIVLAIVGNPALVGKYAIASRLASVVIMACGFFSVPMIAAVGGLHGVRDWTAIRKTYSAMMTAVPLSLGAIVVVLASTYRHVLTIWIGAIPDVVPGLFLLLLFGNFIAVSLTGPGSALCRGVNRLDLEARYALCSVIINILLTVVLVFAFGALGTVIASCVSWVLSALFFLVLLRRRLGLPMPRVALLTPVAAGFAVAVGRVASYAMSAVTSLSTIALGLSIVAMVLVALSAYALSARLCGIRILQEARNLLGQA